jgi:hypothetical protein
MSLEKMVRIDKESHEKLIKLAKKTHRTIGVCCSLIIEYMEAHK